MNDNNKCNAKTQIFSRVVGYYQPIGNWNKGKKEEWKDRVLYDAKQALVSSDNYKPTQETTNE